MSSALDFIYLLFKNVKIIFMSSDSDLRPVISSSDLSLGSTAVRNPQESASKSLDPGETQVYIQPEAPSVTAIHQPVPQDSDDDLPEIGEANIDQLTDTPSNRKQILLDRLNHVKSMIENPETGENAKVVFAVVDVFLNNPNLSSWVEILKAVNKELETPLIQEQISDEIKHFLDESSSLFRVNPEVYLQDFPEVLNSFFYKEIKPNLLIVRNESLAQSLPLVSAAEKPSKLKKPWFTSVTLAGGMLLAAITGASVNNEGADKNQRPLAASLTTEDISRALHQPESSVKLSLNEESNTFQDLEKYFSQNPNEDSQWSAVYNLIKMSGIQEDLGNKPISIVDFKEGSVSDKFLLGGVQFDLPEYLARIREENVFPPCAFVKSPNYVYINEPVAIFAQNNPSLIGTASLPLVFKSPKNGKGMLLDEIIRDNIFSEFEFNEFTAIDYRKLREIQSGTRMAGNPPLRQISNQSKKEN
jgi:hypothetical protein